MCNWLEESLASVLTVSKKIKTTIVLLLHLTQIETFRFIHSRCSY